MAELRWNGDKVLKEMLKATRFGIDDTTAECVRTAKPKTPVVTGTLQGSERATPAVEQGNRVVGQWGSFDVNYALVVEQRVNMLRSSADEVYPKLRQNIKKHVSV